MSAQPRVSLCMIVKDEERNLPRCLESVRSKVDEIIIVDTGSSDKTVEIAESFGARVHFFPWRNDFGAARNESLKHASGDWIFWMDADETLDCRASEDCLREAAGSNSTDACVVPIKSFDENGKSDFHYAIRFFKHYPNIQFEGKVHEQADRHLLEIGARISRASFIIDHFGYAIDQEGMDHKLRRNLDLLRKQVELQSDNSFVHYHIALTLIGLKNEQGSFEALQRALRADFQTPNVKSLVLNLLTFHYLSQKDYSRAEETARQSLGAVPKQNSARLLLGIAVYNQSRYREALACLLPAYQFLRVPVEKRQTDISQEHSYDEADMLRAIAMCYARIGEPSHAIVFFQRYLDIREGDPETFRIMGTCFLNAGNLPRALHYLSLAELGGAALSTMALPLTYIHMQQGNMEEARKYFLALDAEGLGDGQTIALFRSIVEAHYEKHLLSELCGFLERLAINAPHQPFIVDALGTARIKAGNFAAAVEAYESLRVLDPLNPQVARRLAALSLKLGNPAKAEIYLRGIR